MYYAIGRNSEQADCELDGQTTCKTIKLKPEMDGSLNFRFPKGRVDIG